MSEQRAVESLRECREALAALMRVVDRQRESTADAIIEQWRWELDRIGVKDGFGVRADAVLAAPPVATDGWQPHYSGKASVKFWDAVRGIDDDRLYINGCRLQDLEQRILDHLNRFAPPADAPQEKV